MVSGNATRTGGGAPSDGDARTLGAQRRGYGYSSVNAGAAAGASGGANTGAASAIGAAPDAEGSSGARRRTARAIRRYPVLSGIIAVMVVSFVGGVATGFDLLVRLNYVLVLLIGVSWVWSKLGTAQLQARVSRPKGPFAVGDKLRERIVVRSLGRASKAWVELEDVTDLPGASFREIASLGIMVSYRNVDLEATLTQRGEYQLGPLVIRASDPFGLFPREVVYEGVDKILVYPRTVDIPDFAGANYLVLGENLRRQRSNVLSTDVSSVREYLPGDPMGRIHWLTTARTGDLMVKQFDDGSSGEVWVVFDQHVSSQAGEGLDSTDEYAATVVASALERYVKRGIPVGYVGHGSLNLLAAPDTTTWHREQVLRHIAGSRPTGNVPLLQVLAALDDSLRVGSTLVVVTAAQPDGWQNALGALQRRGVRVACVALDRASFGGESNEAVYAELVGNGIMTYRIEQGRDISSALSTPVGHIRNPSATWAGHDGTEPVGANADGVRGDHHAPTTDGGPVASPAQEWVDAR